MAALMMLPTTARVIPLGALCLAMDLGMAESLGPRGLARRVCFDGSTSEAMGRRQCHRAEEA